MPVLPSSSSSSKSTRRQLSLSLAPPFFSFSSPSSLFTPSHSLSPDSTEQTKVQMLFIEREKSECEKRRSLRRQETQREETNAEAFFFSSSSFFSFFRCASEQGKKKQRVFLLFFSFSEDAAFELYDTGERSVGLRLCVCVQGVQKKAVLRVVRKTSKRMKPREKT